ncbi:hypothetical protein Avbf_14415 [Armadillidium vulgare]|nr:hypothetical protein Avbf_14415 [Armadillidium vulgare]
MKRTRYIFLRQVSAINLQAQILASRIIIQFKTKHVS